MGNKYGVFVMAEVSVLGGSIKGYQSICIYNGNSLFKSIWTMLKYKKIKRCKGVVTFFWWG